MTGSAEVDAAAGSESRWSRALDRPSAPSTLFLIAASLVSAGVLLTFFADLTFWRDEWSLLLHRRGFNADALLEPNYEHIVLAPALIYKALLATFGMESPTPFQLLSTLTFLAATSLLYVWLLRRVGGWLALAAVLPVLFLGPSGDDLLWPFQIGYFGSAAFGLAALLALEVGRRSWDVAACVLLAIAMSFSSVGIPFALAVAVLILLGPDPRRRLFVFVIPGALFALWWLGYGRDAGSQASFHDLFTSPGYVLDGFAASASALTGLATPRNDSTVGILEWGRPLLMVLLVFAGLRLLFLGRVPRGLWVALAAGVGFWVLASVNSSLFRQPESGRYVFLGVVFLLMIFGALFSGVRPRRWVTVTLLCVSVVATASNFDFLRQYWNGIKPQGELQRAGLGALELVRDSVVDDFELTTENSDVDYLGLMDAGSYFSAIDSFGSPAFDPQELRGASESARAAADRVFASAHDVRLTKAPGGSNAQCAQPTSLSAGDGQVIEVPPGGALFTSTATKPIEVRLSRYAPEAFVIEAAKLKPGRTMSLSIPPDRSDEPWRFRLLGSGTVSVCPLP